MAILFSGIEAGTGLVDVGKVAVATDDGIRIAALQLFQYKQQSSLLSCSSGVGRLTLLVDASFVANADAAVVITFHMGTS